jgi:hypothetical protein
LDGTGSGSCSLETFGISGVEPLDSAAIVLVSIDEIRVIS